MIEPAAAARPEAAALGGRVRLGEVLRLVTGAGAAYGIIAAATPLLTRLYSPGDFGQFQVYTAIFSFVVAVAAWRYDLAVLLPRDDRDAVTVMSLALVVVAMNAVLCAVIVGAAAYGGLLSGRLEVLGQAGWLLPLALAGGGITTVLTQWSMRVADYNVVNVSRLTQSVTLVAGQVVGALSGFGGTGLMAGDAVGRLAGAASLWHKAWGTHRPVFRALRARDLREMALRYRRFPLISSGSALVNVGGIVLPTIFLSAFGAAPLGWFALVDRVIGSPSSLVGLGVLQVYSAKAAKLAHDDPEALRTLFRDVMLRLAWTGILPFAALASLGPWAFAFVFGESWRPAGEYARVLALMQYVGFVTWPLLHTLNILEHQGWQLVWDIGRLVACALAMWAAARFGGSAMWVVVAYSFSMLLCYCVHVALSYLAINGRIRTMRSRAGR